MGDLQRVGKPYGDGVVKVGATEGRRASRAEPNREEPAWTRGQAARGPGELHGLGTLQEPGLASSGDRATVTIGEFARRYGISRSTAYALAKRDELPVPVIELGRRRVISRVLMERVLAGEYVRQRVTRRETA